DFSIETNVFVPNFRNPGFNSDAFAACVRQNLFAIFLRLAVEPLEAWHGNDANLVAQLFRRGEGVLQFASTRKNDQVEFAAFLFGDITTAQNAFTTQIYIDFGQHWNGLTREREHSRPIGSLHCRYKCACGFFGVSWPNHVDVRYQANRADGL